METSFVAVNNLCNGVHVMAGVAANVFDKQDFWNPIHVENLIISHVRKAKTLKIIIDIEKIKFDQEFEEFKLCICRKTPPQYVNVKIDYQDVENKIERRNNEEFVTIITPIPKEYKQKREIRRIKIELIIEYINKYSEIYIFPRNYAKEIDNLVLKNEMKRILSRYRFVETDKEKWIDHKTQIDFSKKTIMLRKEHFSPYDIFCLESDVEEDDYITEVADVKADILAVQGFEIDFVKDGKIVEDSTPLDNEHIPVKIKNSCTVEEYKNMLIKCFPDYDFVIYKKNRKKSDNRVKLSRVRDTYLD